ncbi:MAG: sigma-70 family RNA polymerase sigma factor [Treponema sp.]|nr:sigma-70 family RNA polymerase sigma factor [Treponema sp.]
MSHEEDYSDRLIVDQILSGQKDLFRLLVRRYERSVYGMGMGFFRNAEDARDFAQEVFLKVYRNLSAFEGRSRFSTWLYKIAYNTALNGVNRRKEYRSLAEGSDEIEASGDDTPEQILLRKAAKEAVLASLRELPERYRICIDMFFFYELSYQEIEVITGFPVNTIKSHVFRAKKLLRGKLEDYGTVDGDTVDEGG